MNLKKISSKTIKQYQNTLAQRGASEATIKRNLSSLRKFSGWLASQGYLKKDPLAPRKKWFPQLLYRPKMAFQAQRALPYFTYLNFIILAVFLTALGWGLYQQFIVRAPGELAYPAGEVGPKRYLSFQGRLTDTGYTPITTAVNMQFYLYDSAGSGSPPTGGNLLWDSGTCSVDPDQDGIFALLLGTTSGDGYTCSSATEIPSHVFSENAEVWLHIKVGSEDLDPRIQIATVAYALNAETLQGFPLASADNATPEATMGATARTVPAINPAGNLVLASDSPTLWSTSGTFGIKGQAITIQTDTGTGGNITLAPDGAGVLNIVPTSGNQIGGTVNATNSALTTGALYTGRVENDNTGFDFLRFFAGSTPTERFSVGALGSIYMANNLDVGGAATITGTLAANGSIISNLIPSGTRNLGSSGSNWDYLYVNNIDAFTLQGAITGNGQSINDLATLQVNTIEDNDDTVLSLNDNLSVTGNILPSTGDTYDLGSSTAYWNNIYVNNLYGGASGISGFWSKASGVIYPNNAYESVAIGGTSTTSAQLYFEGTTGNASMSGNLALFNSGTKYIDSLNGGSTIFRSSAGGDAGLISRLTLGGGGVSYSNLSLYNQAGDYLRFNVQTGGNVNIDSYGGNMYFNWYGASDKDFIFGGGDNNQVARIYGATGNIKTAGVIQVDGSGDSYIQGNLGIGTTSPGAKLDVSGNATFSGTVSLGPQTEGYAGTCDASSEGKMYYDATYDQVLYCDGSKWQADRTVATKIVAANDSQNKYKADYVCDGTNDEVDIEAAISALPSGGGVIYLLDGTYEIGTSIDIAKSNVSIIGAGKGTILKLSNSAQTDVIVLGDGSNPYEGIQISDLKVDGNRNNNTATGTPFNGIYFNKKISRSRILNTWIDNNFGMAIWMYADSDGNANTDNLISENSFYNNSDAAGVTGLRFTVYLQYSHQNVISNNHWDTSQAVYDELRIDDSDWNTIEGNIIEGNFSSASGGGIRLGGSTGCHHNVISNNIIRNNGGNGIYLGYTSNYTTIDSNVIGENENHGIWLARADYNIISNNYLYNNSDGSSNTYDEIHLDRSINYTLITDNNIQTTDARYGIYEGVPIEASDYNVIKNNVIRGANTAPIKIIGDNTTVMGNQTDTSGESQNEIQSIATSQKIMKISHDEGVLTTNALEFDLAQNQLDSAFFYDGASYTDNTTEANSASGTPYTLLEDNADYFYFGKSSTFTRLTFDLATAGSGLTTSWEYSQGGSSWAALTKGDTTSNLSQDGVVYWDIPSDWATDSVNGATRYWVRVSTSAVSTAPTAYYSTISLFTGQFLSLKKAGTELFTIDADGDITFSGSANTITNANQLTLSTNGASSDLVLSAGRDITFDDDNLSSPVPLSVADSALNAALAQGIIDAINDVYDAATGGGGIAGFWTKTLGVLFPNNTYESVTIGGTSTTSAQLYFEGTTGNASMSGQLTLFNSGTNYINALSGQDLSFRTSVGGDTELTDRLYITNAGSVGIGTTEPISKLDVRGDVRLSGELASRGYIVKGHSGASKNNLANGITVSGTGGSSDVPTDGDKTVGSSFYSFGSGSGAGTGPESAYVEIDLGSAKTVSQHKIYFYNDTNRYYWFKLKYSYDGTNWHYAIGNQNIWATSAPNLPGAGTTGELGYITDIRIDSVNARYWRIYGDGSTSNVGNHLYEWEIFQEANPGALEIDDRLLVGGDITAEATISASGDVIVGSTSRASNSFVRVLSSDSFNAGFEAHGNLQGTGYLYVGQSSLYGGGIFYNGDGTPAFATGEANDRISFYRKNSSANEVVFSYSYLNNDVNFRGNLDIDGTGTNTFAGDSNFDSNTLFINATTNYVGIGTGSPTAKLDVNGDASTSGSLVFRGTSPATIDVLNGDDLRFQTSVGGDNGLTPRMMISNAGNVGIGTTAPRAKLDVAGDASTSGSLVFRSTTPSIDTLGGKDLIFKFSQGGDDGLLTKLTLDPDGNLTFSGSANTITNANQLTLSTSGASSDLVLSAGRDITFDDDNLSSPVPLSVADSAINASLTQGIIDAINEAYDAAVGSGGISGFWTKTSGVLFPNNAYESVAIGGTSTTSAQLYFEGTTGDASMSGNLTLAGGGTIATTDMNNLTIGDSNTQNVIINPNGQLRLAYDGSNYTSFTVASDGDLTVKPTGSGQVFFQPTTDSTTFLQVLDSDGGTPILNIDATNEFVGIGTTAPSSSLHVVGSNSVASVDDTDELTADGTFDTSSGWTTGSYWTIASSKATHTTGDTTALEGTTSVYVNAYYQINFTTADRTAGSLGVQLGTNDAGVSITTNASQTVYVRPSGSSVNVKFVPTTDYDGSVDNVTIYQVIPSTADQTITSSDGTSTPLELRAGGSGNRNVFIGTNAGGANISGDSNVAIGQNAFQSNISGDDSIAIGRESLENNTTGYWNTAIGAYALHLNTTGFSNTAIGRGALGSNTTGRRNVAVGSSALGSSTTGWYNTAVGQTALFKNETGSSNTAMGLDALYENITGHANVALGYEALYYTQSGNYNTAVGREAGQGSSGNSFSNNSLFGYRAGFALTTGGNNVLLGYQAGDSLETGSTNIIIGYNVDAPATDTSNYLNIGNTIYGDLSGDKVGIGATSPTAELDVVGDASISGSLVFRSTTPSFDTLGGKDLIFKFSQGGDDGLLTKLTLDPDGNLTFSGSANTITNANQLTLSTSGASSDLIFSAGRDITFDDDNLSSPVPLSVADSAINASLTQGIIDAINEAYDAAVGAGGISGFWTKTSGVLFPNNTYESIAVGGTSTTSAQLYFEGTTGNASMSGQLTLHSAGTNYINALSGQDLSLRTSVGGDDGLTDRLYITNAGNVGIGTTSPSAQLDVAQTISMSSGLTKGIALSLTDNTSGTAGISGLYLNFDPSTGTGTGNKYLAQFQRTAGTGVDLLTVDEYGVTTISQKTPDGVGTGADGAITISTTKTIDSDAIASGRSYADAVNFNISTSLSSGATTIDLGATPNGLAVGDEILIINLRGTSGDYANVGKYETHYLTAINGNVLTLDSSLSNSYDGTTQKIMVQRIPQYTHVFVQNGGKLTVSAYNNTNGKGGVLFFRATGEVTVDFGSSITASGSGYPGGSGGSGSADGGDGGMTYNGTGGDGGGNTEDGQSGQGGGGGTGWNGTSGGTGTTGGGGGGGGSYGRGGGGGGGGYGTVGKATDNGSDGSGTTGGDGGSGCTYACSGGGGGSYGSANLSQVYLGSGSGGGGWHSNSGDGGNGGGILFINASSILVNGTVSASGGDGEDAGSGGGGGGGGGGSLWLKAKTMTLGSSQVTAEGGNGGLSTASLDGGVGGDGRVRLDYTTLSGTTSPTAGYTDSSWPSSTSPDLIVDSYSYGKILSLKQGGTERFYVDGNGNVNIVSNQSSGDLLTISASSNTQDPFTGNFLTFTNESSTSAQIDYLGKLAVFGQTLDIDSQITARGFALGLEGQTTFTDYSSTTGTGEDGAINITDGTKTIDSDAIASGRTYADAVNYNISSYLKAGYNTIDIGQTPNGLAAGDEILIINLRGTSTNYSNVGKYETANISEINGNVLTLDRKLKNNYDGITQKIIVQRVPQYTNVTIGDGVGNPESAILTTSAYNDTNGKGGVLFFRATGNLSIDTDGIASASGIGYSGGAKGPTSYYGGGGGMTYNGIGGDGGGSGRDGKTGHGGGGGTGDNASTGGIGTTGGGGGGAGSSGRGGGGGGGGYGTVGKATDNGSDGSGTTGGDGGSGCSQSCSGGGGGSYGSTNLSTLYLGSGGGGGGRHVNDPGDGGNGGGIIFISASTITVSGKISVDGDNGEDQSGGENSGGGGAGSGGSLWLKAETMTLGSSLVTADGGSGGDGFLDGGDGGDGRIRLDYTTLSGTTSPSVGSSNDFSTPSLLVNRATSSGALLGLQSEGTNKLLVDESGNITTVDDAWFGLGSSAARIEFDDQSTDEINLLGANVGIGTSTPTAKLDVAGDASISGSLVFRSTTPSIKTLGGKDLIFKFSQGGDDGLTTKLTLDPDGNLTFSGSANTITNANQLTLSTSGASSDLVLSAGRDITFDDDNLSSPVPLSVADSALNASLTQGIIDAINEAYDAAVGSGGISGFWTKTSGVLFPNNAYESVAIGGTSTTSAQLYFEGTTGNASMSGQLTLFNSGTNYINALSGQDLSLRTSVGGDASLTDRLYITNAGDVGIGTTEPSGKLEVAGTTVVDSSGGSNLNIGSSSQTSGNPYLYIYGYDSGETTTKYLRLRVDSGGSASVYGEESLWVSGVATNIGAGSSYTTLNRNAEGPVRAFWSSTSGENRLFEIYGWNSVASAPKYGYLQVDDANDEFLIGLEDSNLTGTAIKLSDAAGTSEFRIRDSDSALVSSIDSDGNAYFSGNVGIGTTSPEAPLHVSGSYGSNAALIVDQLFSGDIFTASASGSTKFTVSHDGDLTFSGSANTITNANQLTLSTSGASSDLVLSAGRDITFDDDNLSSPVPLSVADSAINASLTQGIIDAINEAYDAAVGAGGISGFWTKTSGVLFPNNTYESIAVGGTSTTSAQLYFEGTTGNASMSGNLTLAGGGTIAVTDMNNLTIGDSNTQNVIINPNSYVGIGTTTPDEKLQVSSGNIALDFSHSSNLSVNRYEISKLSSRYKYGSTNIETPKISILNYNTGGTGWYEITSRFKAGLSFYTIDEGSQIEAITIQSDGNVGIGTTAPRAKLDVAGDASTSGSLVFRGTSPATIDILNGDDLRFQTSVGGDDSLSPRMTITNAGDVGIGTTNPSQKLEVAGNLKATSGYFSDSVGIGTTDPNNKLTIYQGGGGIIDLETNDNAITGNEPLGTLEFRGLDSIVNHQVGAKIVGVSDATWGGNTYDAPGRLEFYTQSDGTEDGLASPRMVIKSTGNVGIGETAPAGKLEIAQTNAANDEALIIDTEETTSSQDVLKIISDVGGDETTVFNIDANGDITSGTWKGTAVGAQWGGTGQDWSGVAWGSIPYFSNTGVMNTLGPGTAGYVLTTQGASANPTWTDSSSVGTNYWTLANQGLYPTNTSLNLYIGGTATSSAKFMADGGTGDASMSGNLAFAGGGTIGATDMNNLTLGDSSTQNVIINPNGYVGIGTTEPEAKLQVNGSVSTAPTLGIDINSSSTDFTSDFNTASFTNTNTTANNYIKIGFNDSIAGLNSAAIGTIFTDHTNDYADLVFWTRSAGGFTEKVRLTSDGYVGIGTTNPQEKLDIAGNATISGTLALGPQTEGYAGTCNASNAGKMYYDGSANKYYYCDGSSWTEMGGGAAGLWEDGTYGVYENDEAVIVGEDTAFSWADGGVGDLKVEDQLEVGGDASISGDLTLSGGGTIAATDMNTLTIGDSSTGDIQFYSSSNKITSAGNLTIAGDLVVSGGDITGAGDEKIDIGEATANAIQLYINDTSELTLTADYLQPTTNAGLSLGQDSNEWNNLWIDGTAYIDALTMHGAIAMGGYNITDGGTIQANILEDNDDTVLALNDNLSITGNVLPSSGDNYDLGSTTAYWNNLYVNNIYGGGSGTQGFWSKTSGVLYPNNAYESVAIGGTSTTSAQLYFEGTTGNASMSGNLTLAGGGTIGATDMNNLTIGDSNTQNIIINPNSYVGIGTTGPDVKLNISETGGSASFKITDSGVANNYLSLSDYTMTMNRVTSSNSYFTIQTTNSGSWGANTTAGSIQLAPDGSTLLTALASGYVGIGTTEPNEQLEITGNLRLPTTTASTGIIKAGADRFIHNYGTNNTFLGINAGNFTLSGANDNVGIGYQALDALNSGDSNTALGSGALSALTDGVYNTAVGYQALTNLSISTSNSNTAMGYQALYTPSSQSSGNTGMGYKALFSLAALSYNNTGIGSQALYDLTSGDYNTALGNNAGDGITTGNYNTVIGYSPSPLGITSGSYNTILGAQVTGLSSDLSNTVILADGQGNIRTWIDNSGNVGLGTTAPTAELDVSGTASVSALTIRGTSPGYINQINGNDLQFRTSVGGDTGFSEVMTLTNAGNLGIGTTTPGEKVDISGNATVSGNLTFYGTSPTIATTNLRTLTLGDVSTGNVDIYKDLQINGNDILDSTSTTRISLGTTTTISGNLTVTQNLKVDTDTFFVNASTNRVGIGTTDPQAKLDIAGASSLISNSSGDITLDASSGYISFSSDYISNLGGVYGDLNVTGNLLNSTAEQPLKVSDWMLVQTATPSAALMVDQTGSGDIFTASASGVTKFVIKNDGDVGIGTANPGFELSINSSYSGGNKPMLALQNTSGATPGSFGPGIWLDNTVSGKHGYVIQQYQSTGSEFSIANTDSPWNAYLTINQSGNVGIGVANPGAMLDVKNSGGSSYAIRAINSADSDILGGIYENSANDAELLLYDDAGNNDIKLKTDGYSYIMNYVGIGTTNPAVELEVSGQQYINYSTSATADLYFDSTYGTTDCKISLYGSGCTYGFGVQSETLRIFAGPDVAIFSTASDTEQDLRFEADTGAAYADGGWQGAADYAEYFYINNRQINKGDLVSIIDEKTPTGVGSIELADNSNSNKLIGIISTAPGFVGMLSDDTTDAGNYYNAGPDAHKYRLVSMLGQAPVKVSTENGSIETNAPISISSLPGIGAKALKPGRIIGTTTEAFKPEGLNCQEVNSINNINWPEDNTGTNKTKTCFRLPDGTYVGKIMVFVNVSWYDPDVYLTDIGELNIQISPNENNPNGSEYSLKRSTGETIDRIGAFGQAIIASLKTGFIQTQELITDSLTVNQRLVSPVVETSQIIAENIETKRIDAEESKFGKLLVENEQGETVASIDSSGNASFGGLLASEELIVSEDATIAGELHVGKIYADEVVGRKATFGDLLAATISAGAIDRTELDEIKTRLSELEGKVSASPTPTPTIEPTATPTLEPTPIPTESPEASDSGALDPSSSSSSGQLDGWEDWSITDPSDDILLTSDITITGDLTTYGITSLADTTIAGQLMVDANIIIDKDGIQTLPGSTLKLQAYGWGGIDMLGGKVVIDTEGNVLITGNLAVAGNLATSGLILSETPLEALESREASESGFGKLLAVINKEGKEMASIDASGSAFFAQLGIEADYTATQSGAIIAAADNYYENGYLAPAIKTNATAGIGLLPANEEEVMIYNPQITGESLIYVTATSNTENKVLYVKTKKAYRPAEVDESGNEITPEEKGWFIVALNEAINRDIQFNWWIIGGKSAITNESNLQTNLTE